jgi:hypothetical protein
LTQKSIYRGRSLLNEVVRIPFPLPEDAPGADPAEAIRAVAETFNRIGGDHRFGGLGHQQLMAEAKRELTKHVYSYFDVSCDEEILIDYTVKTLQRSATPSRHSKVRTLAVSKLNDRQTYVNTLIDALHAWAGGAGVNLGVRCVLSEKVGVAVLTIAKARGRTRYIEVKAPTDLDEVLLRLNDLSPDRYGSLVYLRNLAILEPPDRMHVVKPLSMRFWLRSAALNDADAAASHLLTRRAQRVKA